MSALDDRIAAAEQKAQAAAAKLKELKARQEAVEARKLARFTKGQRAEDIRRKILAGALVLDMMARDPDTRARFLKHLDGFVTRDDDRALFGLPPRPQPGRKSDTLSQSN